MPSAWIRDCESTAAAHDRDPAFALAGPLLALSVGEEVPMRGWTHDVGQREARSAAPDELAWLCAYIDELLAEVNVALAFTVAGAERDQRSTQLTASPSTGDAAQKLKRTGAALHSINQSFGGEK